METRTLGSPPPLPMLYAKGALSLVPGGGDDLPDHALRLAAAEIDRRAVAEYAHLCGFSLGQALPPTYPHILRFPLALRLMTERAFPFSLLGLLHIADLVEQREPIALDATPALRVWAESLRPHHRGRQFDVVTEATVEGKVVWREHSTYLRTGKSVGERPEPGEDPLAGAETAAVWDVAGDVGRRYAAVSGDRNPIHLHPLSARLFGFPRAIAHGMWSYARALASLGGQLPDELRSRAEFRSPLRIPSRVRLLALRRNGGWRLALESHDGAHRHLEMSVEPR